MAPMARLLLALAMSAPLAAAQSTIDYAATNTVASATAGVPGAQAELAIDGDFATAFESISGALNEPSVTLDLGEVRQFTAVNVFFLDAFGVLPNQVFVSAGYSPDNMRPVELIQGTPGPLTVKDATRQNGLRAEKLVFARFVKVTVQAYAGDDQDKPFAKFAEIVIEGESCAACPAGRKFDAGTCNCVDCGCIRGQPPAFEGKYGVKNYGQMEGRQWWGLGFEECKCEECQSTPVFGKGVQYDESSCDVEECDIPPYHKLKASFLCEYEECPPCEAGQGIVAGLEVQVIDQATNEQRCTCEQCPPCPEGKWSDPNLKTACNCVDVPPSPPPPPPPPPAGRAPTMALQNLIMTTGGGITLPLSFEPGKLVYSTRITHTVEKLSVTTTVALIDQNKLFLEVKTPQGAVNITWDQAATLDIGSGIGQASVQEFDVEMILRTLPQYNLEPVTYVVKVARNPDPALGGGGGGGSPTLSTSDTKSASEDKLGDGGIAAITIVCVIVLMAGGVALMMLNKSTAARAEAAKELLVDIPTTA